MSEGMPVIGEPLYECSFLIPVRRDRILSDGKRHHAKTWLWLERELTVFGGATRAPELYEGWYVDPDTGEQVRDHSRKYWVAMPNSRLNEIRSLLRQACSLFQQKCIYLSIAGRVEFLEGESNASA